MPEIKFNITTTEEKCLNTVMVGIGTWADNVVTNRARIARDEICTKLMAHCNANGIAIGVGITAQVEQAYTLNVIKTASDRRSGSSSE